MQKIRMCKLNSKNEIEETKVIECNNEDIEIINNRTMVTLGVSKQIKKFAFDK